MVPVQTQVAVWVLLLVLYATLVRARARRPEPEPEVKRVCVIGGGSISVSEDKMETDDGMEELFIALGRAKDEFGLTEEDEIGFMETFADIRALGTGTFA